MKTYIFLASGFEEIEAIAPIDILRRAGIEVVTVSISDQKMVTGSHGLTVIADILFSEVKPVDVGMIFLPGGLPGTTNLDAHKELKELIHSKVQMNFPVAAICAAPSVLGKMGLLKGIEAICYPGFEKFMIDATVSEKTIVQTGNILTAKAAGVAIPFALSLVELLKGKSVADDVAHSIYYQR